ncbi:MAG TPA: MFS transporter, partial [Blastocatellia bacterium]|nr:MFS transporter [Blastocatellia bacterium]
SAFTSITAAIGPVIGGWLIEHATWRAAFFLNVPIAVVVLLIVFWRVPESRGDTIDRIDLAGAVLATAGLGSLIYGLIESSGEGWGSVPVVASLSAGVILLTAFVLVETRSKHPMLPLALFKSLNFSGANLLTLLLYAPLTGGLFFFPLNLIQVQKYSATQSGAALLPFILLMFLLSRWSGGLVTRYGARLPLTVGPLIAAVGFCLFTIPSVGVNYWSGFLPAVLVLGLGMAISVAPLTTTVMSAVEPEQSGIASGVNNAVSRTAGVLAIAVFGVVMLWVFSGALERRLSDVPISSELRQTLMSQRVRLAGIEPPGDVQPEARLLVEDAIARSFVRGFRAVMFAAAGSAALSGVFAYMMIEGRGGRRRGEWETR